LREDDVKAEKDASDQKTDILKTASDTVLQMGADAAIKAGEQVVSNAVTTLFADNAAAIGGFIKSVMALPFPFNVAAIGGGVALIGGLFAGLLNNAKSAKGADQGLVYRPERGGSLVNGQGELIAIGETGKKEFVAPEETFLQYASQDLTPRIQHIFDSKLFPGKTNSFNKPVVPNLPPAPHEIQQAQSTMKLHKTLDHLHNAVTHLATNGVQANVTAAFKVKGDDLQAVLRANDKKVTNRARASA
jgi:hypothetical protein